MMITPPTSSIFADLLPFFVRLARRKWLFVSEPRLGHFGLATRHANFTNFEPPSTITNRGGTRLIRGLVKLKKVSLQTIQGSKDSRFVAEGRDFQILKVSFGSSYSSFQLVKMESVIFKISEKEKWSPVLMRQRIENPLCIPTFLPTTSHKYHKLAQISSTWPINATKWDKFTNGSFH